MFASTSRAPAVCAVRCPYPIGQAFDCGVRVQNIQRQKLSTELRGDCLAVGLVAIRDPHIRACACEGCRACRTDSRRAAGDKRDSIFQVE
jgi:hypothetical protein